MRILSVYQEGNLSKFTVISNKEKPEFKTPAESIDSAIELLLRITTVFDIHQVNYSICDGTLLGHIRDHGFITGDNDIDIAVDRSALTEQFFIDCQKIDLIQFKRVEFDNGFTNIGLYYKDVRLDLYSRQRSDTDEMRYFKFKYGYLGVRVPYSGNESTNMLGINIMQPKNPEQYLTACYGENWKTPASEWDHLFSHQGVESIYGDKKIIQRGMKRWLISNKNSCR